MKIARTEPELRAALPERGGQIGFVPTMGALHEGHLSLVRAAAQRCSTVVVSIFVNPLQFGPTEDLQKYPRDEKSDLQLLEKESVDLVFFPSVDTMYPAGRSTMVSVGALGTRVEGLSRPGHFDGVATVVAKLFNLVQPNIAFFGQKDAQQLAVIKKMVADLSIPVEVIGCPIIRESDGLAMSSRNGYLDTGDRSRAISLWRSLQVGRAAFERGADRDEIEKLMWESLIAGGVDPDYAHVVDPDTFESSTTEGPALAVVAARAGRTRLIDNLLLSSGD
ncbi:MAG: pantoate--beta-alanine ligase [Actinomycetota bacterium]|nr:pantoate--beta-alanine ligase [Actinomycetota bacterium]